MSNSSRFSQKSGLGKPGLQSFAAVPGSGRPRVAQGLRFATLGALAGLTLLAHPARAGEDPALAKELFTQAHLAGIGRWGRAWGMIQRGRVAGKLSIRRHTNTRAEPIAACSPYPPTT